MATIHIDLNNVVDFPSFHSVFAKAMGFPDFYGNNMNAWEDCMSDISQPHQKGMTAIVAEIHEDVTLVLHDSKSFRGRAPDVSASFLDSVAHVNINKAATSGGARLHLLFL